MRPLLVIFAIYGGVPFYLCLRVLFRKNRPRNAVPVV